MTLDTVTKIIHLRAAKTPQHKIAKDLGLCTRTVLRVLKKHAHEFALREIEVMEAIFERSGINHESQVLAQAAHLKKLEAALADCAVDEPQFERLSRMTQVARKNYFDFKDRAYAKLDKALDGASEEVDLDEFEPKTPSQPVRSNEPAAPESNSTTQETKTTPTEQTPTQEKGSAAKTKGARSIQDELEQAARASEIWERIWKMTQPKES